MSQFRNMWKMIGQACGVTIDTSAKWQHLIELKYTEEHRHYHTMTHIENMCHLLEKYEQFLCNPSHVFYATAFHDVIYNPKSSENEEKSDELFREFAHEANIEENTSRVVSEMILLTKHHLTEAHRTPGLLGTLDIHYFLDFDMAILGSAPQDYSVYADQIRQEYIHIPEDVFRKTRAQVLREFLKTPNIFATEELRRDFEHQSRQNIQDEIETLENTGNQT